MANLKRFSQAQLQLDRPQAFRVLKFFFGDDVRLTASDLTVDDMIFAQGLLVEAIDASYEMGFVQVVFDSFYAKVPRGSEIGDLIKDFVKDAAKHWFEHATEKDLLEAKIYDSVRTQLRANFISVWRLRLQTGDLTY
jgi:hypothetical protein